MDEIKEILGGINELPSNTNVLTVSGGFQSTKHIENRVSIGNASKMYLKNKMFEWTAFKDTYYTKNKLDDKHYKQLLCVMNDIFPLPIYTTDENEILFLINGIYKANSQEIMNALVKSTTIYSPLQASIRHLFMIYKIYLEKLIEKFVVARNKHIDEHKLKNDKNNLNRLIARWNSIDAENNINTSSLMLFFNFPPPNTKLEKSIPQLEWDIKGNEEIDAFHKAIKKSKFNYIGFCPHVPIHRFKLLLQFPVKELIAATQKGRIYSSQPP